MTLKLYTVVRHDISPGAQAAQSAHALAALALKHPYEFRKWDNQTIVLLKTTPWRSLDKIVEAAEDGEFTHAAFTEPDALPIGGGAGFLPLYRSNLTTAVAFAPNWLVQNVLVAGLPLALREETKKKGWFSR